MEQEYVIGVANRYALFLEENSHEEDPYEIIKNAEAEKTKKKTLKSASGESKENKGKPDLKAKTTLPSARKAQGIKETQNVKANDAGAVNKPKPQDGGLKTNRPAGGRKPGDRPQGDRQPTTGEGPLRTFKFASGEPQGERTNNRRPRDDKAAGERNGDVPRNRNFRDGDRVSKGPDNENGPRGPRNDEGRRGPRRDGERPFRGDRQGGEGEGKPPRRENRERRDFQERTDFPREGTENGESRPERRPGPPMGRTKGNRQGGTGRNFDNRGKREFDRKSGSDKTGVKAVDKREGAGAHNWGNHRDDLEAVNLNSTNTSEENAEWSETKSGYNDVSVNDSKDGEKNATDSEPAPPVEEEPKELTLDEYRALRGRRELPQYNLRKAGEGEDLTQWKNMYEIKKKKDSEEHEEEEYDATENTQRGARQRLLLDIDITFSDSRRGSRGGRGGRAPRGGINSASSNNRTRQRDGQRRGRDDRNEYGGGRDREYRGNRQAAPKVDDEHDFPSLGSGTHSLAGTDLATICQGKTFDHEQRVNLNVVHNP